MSISTSIYYFLKIDFHFYPYIKIGKMIMVLNWKEMSQFEHFIEFIQSMPSRKKCKNIISYSEKINNKFKNFLDTNNSTYLACGCDLSISIAINFDWFKKGVNSLGVVFP